MYPLKKISPVESLMVQSPLGVTGKSLLKYCFLELLDQGVLECQEEWRVPHPRLLDARKYIFINRGPNFRHFRAHTFHLPFLTPFQKQNVSLQLRHLLSRSFKILRSTYNYKQKVVSEHMKANGYLSKVPFIDSFNLYFLSGAGKELKGLINQELGPAREALRHHSKAEHMCRFLQRIGSNWLLLDLESPDVLNQIQQAIKVSADTDQSLQHIEHTLKYLQHVNYSFNTFDFSFTGYETNFERTDMKDFEI